MTATVTRVRAQNQTTSSPRAADRSGEPIVLSLPGQIDILTPDDLETMTTYVLLEQEDWFEQEIGFVRRATEPGMRAIDIGANLGVYSLTLANGVGAAGKVRAYEPDAATAALLRASAARNGFAQIEVVEAAVAARAGVGRLCRGASCELTRVEVTEVEPAGQAQRDEPVDQAAARRPNVDGEASEQPVALVTLDEHEADEQDAGFLKIDAEGHELAVIEGGVEFLTRCSPLIMIEVKRDGEVDLAPLERLRTLGYAAYRLVPGLQVLEPVAETATLDRFQLNLFACKPDRRDALARRGLLIGPQGAASQEPHGPAAPDQRTGRWGDVGRAQSWSRGFARDWTKWAAGASSCPNGKLYKEAMLAWTVAQDETRGKGDRAAALYRAWQTASAALERRPQSLPRLLTCARIARDLGLRDAQIQALARVLGLFKSAGAPRLDEPFLAVDARFDRCDPKGRLGDWLTVSVLETLDRASAHSSFFNHGAALGAARTLVDRKFCSPQTVRRLVLTSQRAGLEVSAVLLERLRQTGRENRNARYWTQFADA